MDDQTNTSFGATQPVDNTQTEQTNQILENLNEVAPVENNVLNTDQDDTAFKPEAFEPTSIPTPTLNSSSSDTLTNSSDLAELKKKALNELSPLVQLLDQEPSDKFKTLMMMIQASDDQSLIPQAYEAASKISNDKEKAQALLDVVNEINYFSQTPATT